MMLKVNYFPILCHPLEDTAPLAFANIAQRASGLGWRWSRDAPDQFQPVCLQLMAFKCTRLLKPAVKPADNTDNPFRDQSSFHKMHLCATRGWTIQAVSTVWALRDTAEITLHLLILFLFSTAKNSHLTSCRGLKPRDCTSPPPIFSPQLTS